MAVAANKVNDFGARVEMVSGEQLAKDTIRILQVNLGKLCNLACTHCHVEAGPTKTKENMNEQVARAIVRLMDDPHIETLDLTGGAPELNPHFRMLVIEAKKRNLHCIDRCNLTVLFEEGMEDLPQFLAEHSVEVVASLPCYSEDNVDKQRGRGTFAQSIRALKKLNALGYGRPDSLLKLNLVYNPVGPHLPPEQCKLESTYKDKLRKDFGIEFNALYTITNMAIKRYARYLKAFNQLDDYEALLETSFNAATIAGLMCKNTVSISWDGKIYDCDFNQMLDLNIPHYESKSVIDLDLKGLAGAVVATAKHCFGCTAGAGSSCQGALE